MLLTMKQAADYLKVSKQAVHWAYLKKRLKGEKASNGRTYFLKQDIDEYVRSKYIRKETTVFNGEKVYQNEDYISIREASKVFNIPVQHLYYIARNQTVTNVRVGWQYVLLKKEIEEYKELVYEPNLKASSDK